MLSVTIFNVLVFHVFLRVPLFSPPPPPVLGSLRLSSEPGGFLWLRQLHGEHCRQRADELPVQPGDGDDPRGLHDVCGRGIPHDDPALSPGHQHHAF